MGEPPTFRRVRPVCPGLWSAILRRLVPGRWFSSRREGFIGVADPYSSSLGRWAAKGQIRPWCSIGGDGSLPLDSFRTAQMPAMAELGHEPTSHQAEVESTHARISGAIAGLCAPYHTLCAQNYGSLPQFERCDSARFGGLEVYEGAP